MEDAVSIVGVRGFGLPICRRLGQRGRLLIGDRDANTVEHARETLMSEGYDVIARQIDITDMASVSDFANVSAQLGTLRSFVCTAGLSGSMADAQTVFGVNMMGMLNLVDAIVPLAGRGATLVFIASNAAYMVDFSAEDEAILARGSREEIMAMFAGHPASGSGLGAYCLSKRGNQLRVQALAPSLGRKGIRIATISPGVVATPMSQFERTAGSPIDDAVANTPMGRFGHPEDIAAAVGWLTGPEAGFLTGIDLLIDGGMTAARKWPDA